MRVLHRSGRRACRKRQVDFISIGEPNSGPPTQDVQLSLVEVFEPGCCSGFKASFV